MSDQETSVDEDEDGVAQLQNVAATKGRRSFKRLSREMSEKELSSPGAQKLLLDDIDRLENELLAAREFREKFHVVDKKAAILEEKILAKHRSELLYDGCLLAGAALLGFAPNQWANGLTGTYLAIVGVILIGAAIYTHWIKK